MRSGEPISQSSKWQFSIGQLMLVQVFLAAGFALLLLLHVDGVPMVAQLAVLGGFAVFFLMSPGRRTQQDHRSRRFYDAAWCLALATYGYGACTIISFIVSRAFWEPVPTDSFARNIGMAIAIPIVHAIAWVFLTTVSLVTSAIAYRRYRRRVKWLILANVSTITLVVVLLVWPK